MYVVAEINIQSIDEVLEKVVKWSQKAEMSSVNRASLPSLIILINRCDPAKTEQWSSDEATAQIFDEKKDLMRTSMTIKNRQDQLQNFGLPHESIKDILENFYAAVRFLRLPTANNTARLRSQIQELYAMNRLLEKDCAQRQKGGQYASVPSSAASFKLDLDLLFVIESAILAY